MRPILFDATTLRNFAVAGRLDVLEQLAESWAKPLWTEAVHDEIERGSTLGETECLAVLVEAWLGDPARPTRADHRSIQRLMVALGDGLGPSTSHGGEAESIQLAEKLGGQFATDDNAAYDLARRKLGDSEVLDSVDLLRMAISSRIVTTSEAISIAHNIRQGGRHLRRVHPLDLSEADFE